MQIKVKHQRVYDHHGLCPEINFDFRAKLLFQAQAGYPLGVERKEATSRSDTYIAEKLVQ